MSKYEPRGGGSTPIDQSSKPRLSPPARSRPTPNGTGRPPNAAGSPPAAKVELPKASGRGTQSDRQSAREKKQPAGNYEIGYGRPPVKNRFQKGNKLGGRKSGSENHDTILRRLFDEKRQARIGGKVKTISTREYVLMSFIKHAAEGKVATLKDAVSESARLYPAAQEQGSQPAPEELTATDQAIIDWFADELRARNQKNGNRATSRCAAAGFVRLSSPSPRSLRARPAPLKVGAPGGHGPWS